MANRVFKTGVQGIRKLVSTWRDVSKCGGVWYHFQETASIKGTWVKGHLQRHSHGTIAVSLPLGFETASLAHTPNPCTGRFISAASVSKDSSGECSRTVADLIGDCEGHTVCFELKLNSRRFIPFCGIHRNSWERRTVYYSAMRILIGTWQNLPNTNVTNTPNTRGLCTWEPPKCI